MEIKDIEYIIERYFQGQTTEQEEALLREAFVSGNVPAEIAFYKDYFLALQEEADVKMSEEFDARLRNRLALMESSRTATFKSRIVDFNQKLKPLYKAVASVALIITVGVTAGQYWSSKTPDPVEYNYSNYHDTYSDPEVARQTVTDALKDLSEAFKMDKPSTTDSLASVKNSILED